MQKTTFTIIMFFLFLSYFNKAEAQETYSIFPNESEYDLNSVKSLGEFGNRFIYFDRFSSTKKLYATDGTAEGTVLLDEGLTYFGKNGDTWYFKKNIGETTQVLSLLPNEDVFSEIFTYTSVIGKIDYWNDAIYFLAESTTVNFADDLLKYDLATGTTDILFTSEFGGIRGLGHTDEAVYFIASMDAGKMLGKTDGSLAGTSIFHQLYEAGNELSQKVIMKSVGNQMYFFYHPTNFPYTLWTSDGNTEGTLALGEYTIPAFDFLARDFAVYDNKFCFTIKETGAPSGATEDLFITDGTVEGTLKLNPFSIHLHPHSLTQHNGELYFIASGDGFGSLMKTDGTSEGVEVVLSNSGHIGGGSGIGRIRQVNNYQGQLAVSAYNNNTGQEVYISDGTTGNFELLANATGDYEDSSPFDFNQVGDKLFFGATTNFVSQYWVYDPNLEVVDCTTLEVANTNLVNATSSTLGSFSIEITGGEAPYSYQLNEEAVTDQSLFTDLVAGTYSLEITDGQECVLEYEFTIEMETLIEDIIYGKNIRIYPNPAQSEVTLNLSESDVKAFKLIIYNSLGKQVLSQSEMRSDIVNIQLENLTSGLYYIRLIQEEGTDILLKFMIEK